MVIYSRSPKQNFDNWWFWIRKNKRIASFNNDPSAFIECSNTVDDVYENIDD